MTEPGIVLSLRHKRNNPRNSEGSFITLADGRIMFAYSRYYGTSWRDDATADICARFSSDGGRTWTKRDRILVRNEGGCNVMSVSLLRLQDKRIALFYLRKNSPTDCRARMRISLNEGKTWSKPVLCIPGPGYFVVNNDRVIQVRGGRLIIPAAYHRSKGAFSKKATDEKNHSMFDRGIAMFFLSDDCGRTWKEAKDWWALPVRSESGLQEPGVVELSDGRLYAYSRTSCGCQYELFSEDGGETWSSPRPSVFRSPRSPLSIKRIPSTGDLLAVWNDHSGRWRLPPAQPSSWGRTPLVIAVSKDDGMTWQSHQPIETDPDRGFCYTAIHFTEEALLLAYCCGGRRGAVLQDTCIRRIPLDLIYRPLRRTKEKTAVQ